MMQLSKTLLNTLQRLIVGEPVAASALHSDIADMLLSEGLLTVRTHGSRRSFAAVDTSALKTFLSSHYEELRGMDFISGFVGCDNTSRSGQAARTGNSKLVAVRSCPGFPVNSYNPVTCMLNGREFIVSPPDGSFVFVADWQSFAIPSDVVVVGIENMENFRMVRKQRAFFEDYFYEHYPDAGTRLLFVSRYPQSTDLRTWLQSIPNTYVHFGDFDLAGINIFLTEFYKYLGTRSSYLIPDDIEVRIINGSTRRYNDQYARFHNMSTHIPPLQRLISLINKYHRCYDQEGYITQNE